MADILHRIGVEQSSTAQVYDALTTLDGLSGWWAEHTSGQTEVGGVAACVVSHRDALRGAGSPNCVGRLARQRGLPRVMYWSGGLSRA